MACYGGECTPACPMYDIHHPWIVECAACGAKTLSWYVEDGQCPSCGSVLPSREAPICDICEPDASDVVHLVESSQ